MKKKTSYGGMITYYIFFFLVLIGIYYMYISNNPSDNRVMEVDYSTFLQEIENGQVEKVEMEATRVYYYLEDEDVRYRTGRANDPELVNRLYENNIEFKETIKEEPSPFVSMILMWIVPLAIIIALYYFLFKRFQKSNPGSPMNIGASKVRIHAETTSNKTFADVAGQDEAKEALQEVVDFLHNPNRYKEIGAKMPKGVLLVGPPGTGKTLLARAVAGESKVPFFSISGSEFVEMFVGVGAARVRDLFKQAREKAPCIVFIDELDTIGKSRAAMISHSNNETEQTLNQLLSEMDGFEADEGIVILAATNRPESLDKALLRAGRFDRRIPVELPDIKGREAILKVHAKNVKLSDDVDLSALAKATPGASGADLANIVNEGALRAVKLGRNEVNQEDLDKAVEVIIAGYEKKNAVITEEDKLKIAYHEIGHALVAAKLEDPTTIHKITIIPRTSGPLGFTMKVNDHERVLLSKEQALNQITTFMGGRAAEELIFNSITSGASNDSQQATRIARAMVTRFGMSDYFDMMTLETINNPYLSNDASLLVSPETATRIDAEILAIIKSCHNKAKHILENNMDKLHELAEELLEKETLSGEEFLEILNRETVKV